MNNRNLLLLAVVSCLILFVGLGDVPLLDPDEPVYAQTPKEMLAAQDLLSPRIYGEYWYDKPPMYYWLVAGSFSLFGVNEFAARFPSAVMGLGCVFYLFFAVRRLLNETAAFWSAMVMVTSLGFFYIAKAAVTDMTLNLFLMVAFISLFEKRYWLTALAAGLAVVTKGPVGLLFPGAVLTLYSLASGEWKSRWNGKLLSSFLLFFLVALPWYGYMVHYHGNAFVDTFLGFHNVTRFTNPEHPETNRWYFYFPVLLVGLFPWAALLPRGIYDAVVKRSGREQEFLVYVCLWFALIFVFFTVSSTKLVSYILPLYPAAAILIGAAISRMILNWRERINAREWMVGGPLLIGLFIAGWYMAIKTMPELTGGALPVIGLFAVCGVWLVAALWRREWAQAAWSQVLMSLAFSLVLILQLFPAAAPRFASNQLAVSLQQQYDQAAPLYIVKFLRPGVAFYSNLYGSPMEKEKIAETVTGTTGKAYFIMHEREFTDLPPVVSGTLTLLAQHEDKMLLLRQ